MGDCISREAAIEAFDDPSVERYYGDVDPDSVIRVIEQIPAADVRPVVRGEWQFHMFTANSWGYECRVCHTTWDAPTNFCPNCGADMREEADGT